MKAVLVTLALLVPAAALAQETAPQTYSVTIDLQGKVDGITAARNQYNSDNSWDPSFVPLTTNEQYVQFVMDRAAQSYCHQYSTGTCE
jgi:hypothetical protein